MKTLLKVSLIASLLSCSSANEDTQNRWQKIDINGQPVAIKLGPWSCAKDTTTGLTWEVKSWQESVHYYKSDYSYFEADTQQGYKDGGTCRQGDNFFNCDTSDLLQSINEEKYCGLDNWRIPSLTELKTLTYKKDIKGKLQINPYIFPRATRTNYMTSDTQLVDGELKVMQMDFLNLNIDLYPAHAAVQLRMVSGKK